MGSSSGKLASKPESGTKIFLESQCEFVLEKLKEKETIENLIFSPISLFFSLETIFLGSKNETAKQIQNLLGKDLSEEEIHEYFSNVWSDLKIAKDLTIFPVLKLFLSKKHEFLESYKQKLDKYYQGTFENVDFDNVPAVVARINKHIYDVTEGNIDNVVNVNSFQDESRIISVDSLYFDAKWESFFCVQKTRRNVDFYVNETKTIKVDYMIEERKSYFHENSKYQVLGLSFKNEDYAMFFILPRKKDGLLDVLKNLGKEKLKKHLLMKKKNEVFYRIPKFKMEMGTDFTEDLKKIGVVDLFDKQKCDVSQISTEPELSIALIRQKNFITIDEEGVKAGCVTLHDLYGTGVGGGVPEFIADHPFAYFIVERTKASRCNILFAGNVVEPVADSNTTGIFVTNSQMKFGIEFCKNCYFTKNSIIGPFSLFLNLAAIGIGADDGVAKQIFGFLADDDISATEIHKYLRHELQPKEYEPRNDVVKLFFKIFVDKNLEVDDDFVENVKKYYSDVVKQIDFSKESEVGNEVIKFFNECLDTVISEKIQLDSKTKIILANTVYLSLRWSGDSKGVSNQDFFVNETTIKKVEMIELNSKNGIWEFEDYYLCQLDLTDELTFLYIVLPKEKFGLKNIVEKIDIKRLMTTILDDIPKYSLNLPVRIPEFALESSFRIEKELNNLAEVFESCENFDKIGKNVKNVDKVQILQKVQIQLTVNGIQNGTTKETNQENESKEENNECFAVNHPFAYFLVRKPEYFYWNRHFDIKTETFQLLLSGIVIDPTIDLKSQ